MAVQVERALGQPAGGELGEEAWTYASMLRAAAERWRFRARAGRVEAHALEGSLRLAAKLEDAASVLEGDISTSDARPPNPDVSPSRLVAESEERFRLLVESVRDYGIFMLDPQGRIQSWNRGAERIKGYRADEILGKHFSVFYTEDAVRIGHPQRELEIANELGRYEEEGWRVRKDGSRFWANVVITALRDRDGRLRGFAKVTRDFTERKRADEALQQSEQRLRMLIEGVKDYAIFMLDIHGNVTSWNTGAEHIKGYKAEEIIGRHFSLFYPPEEVARRHPEHELEIAAREGRYEEEGYRVRKDGSRFWANVVINAVHEPSGRLVGFTKITRDMTDRRQAQESLQRIATELEQRVEERTRELRAANQELEAFSYSVSHDLRAPLRAIDGFSKMLLTNASDKLTGDEKDYFERIRKAAQRMSQLIDDLLNLSRLSRVPLRLENSDLSEMASSVLSELRQTEPARQVQVAVQEGLFAQADPRLIRIVLENLLQNAWKFTRNASRPRIEVGSRSEGGRPAFFVRDNGAGFDVQYAGKLFTPFSRLHSIREFEGTGIGLATVNRIVRRHGGSVWAESQPGQGATFFFTIEASR